MLNMSSSLSSSPSSSLLDQYMDALARSRSSQDHNATATLPANARSVPDLATSDPHRRLQTLLRQHRQQTGGRRRHHHHHPHHSTTNHHPRGFAAVRCSENPHRIRLCLDLPGVAPDDLTVHVNHGVLVIQGTRLLRRFSSTSGSSSEPVRYRQQHKFCRRFALDTDVVDPTRMRANLHPRTGVLEVTAPKVDRPKALQILVTHNDYDHDEDEVVPAPVSAESSPEVVTQEDREEEEELTEEVMAAADRAAAPTSLSKTRSAQSIAATAEAVAALAVSTAAPEDPGNSPEEPSAARPQEPHLSRNFVSMGSAEDALEADALEAAQAMVSVRLLASGRTLQPSKTLKSHKMIRRSMSNPKVHQAAV